MNQTDESTATGRLAAAVKAAFQLGYVTNDGARARAEAQKLLGVGEFHILDSPLDIIDDSGAKIDEVKLIASFALDRAFEIIEPVDDPTGIFRVPDDAGTSQLTFHHVGAVVDDLAPYLAEAHEQSLEVLRLQSPAIGLNVAFVDLTALTGHRLELLSFGSG